MEAYIKNTKLIFKLFANESNWESVTRNVNISHKNLNYLHARLIHEHIKEADYNLTEEVILKWVAEDDINNIGFEFGSKEIKYATTVNTVFGHHRLLYIKEIFDNEIVEEAIGFNAINAFLDLPEGFHYHDNVMKYENIVNAKIVKKIVGMFSIDFYILSEKTIQEIVNLLEEKPIILIDDYLVLSSSSNFINTYIETLTYILKENEQFKKIRGDKFEKLVFEICQFYYGEKVCKNIEFPGGESDIIIETEDMLCVIECKAIMPYRIYRWNQKRPNIENNLNDVILKPLQQGLKFFENLDLGNSFSYLGERKVFDKSKKRMVLSISVDQILGWRDYMECHFPSMLEEVKVAEDMCTFRHLSYSDFLSVHQSIVEQIVETNNFDDGLSGILLTPNLTSDFLENFQFMHTTPIQLREHMLKMKEEGVNLIIDQQFQALSEHDKYMESIMIDYYRNKIEIIEGLEGCRSFIFEKYIK